MFHRRSTLTASALQQILKNLLSNAFKFTHEGNVTLTDSARGKGPTVLEPDARAAPDGACVCGYRYRHWHSEGQAAADFRGVPASRRNHQPQVRRHRTRAFDQPRDRASARRRDQGGEHAETRAALHAVPAGALRGARKHRRPRREQASRQSTCAAHVHDVTTEPDVAADASACNQRAAAAAVRRRSDVRAQYVVEDDQRAHRARRSRQFSSSRTT